MFFSRSPRFLLRRPHSSLFQQAQTVAAPRAFSSFNSSNNNSLLIINAVGRDRLGLVSEVTGHVIDHGGSVGDSQASRLGPYFSLMMLVELPQNNTTNLEALKARLETMKHMNATVFEAADVAGEAAAVGMMQKPDIAYKGFFTLEGADHPGIVFKLTTALAAHGLSIDKLTTTDQVAPYGGAVLFQMKGVVTAAAPLAQSFDATQIQDDLAALGDALNCEVTLEEISDADGDADYEGSFIAG